MDFELYFCTDGVLRAKWSDKKPLLPLKYIQEQSTSNDNDFKFMARWWDCNTYFEDGLTIGSFFEALKPWQEFWGNYTNKDIAAYIEEVKKPILVEKNDEHPITWINLFYQINLSPCVEYKREKDDMDDLNAWFNSPKKTRLTGNWSIDAHYSLSGYSHGHKEHYGIDHSPINKFANTPFYLSNKQVVHVMEHQIKSLLSEDRQLINKNGFGLRKVTQTETGFSKEIENDLPLLEYIQADKYHSLRDVIDGFFYWFASTPQRRDDSNDELREIVKNSRKEIEEMKNTKENSEENIIDIKTKKPKKKSKKDKLEVKVASGAFSGLIDDLESKSNYWDTLINIAQEDNIIPRIGKIKKSVLPENRIYGYIVKEKDLKTEYVEK